MAMCVCLCVYMCVCAQVLGTEGWGEIWRLNVGIEPSVKMFSLGINCMTDLKL